MDLFCDIADEINGRLGPNFGRDEDWCDSINQTRKLMEDDIMDWLSRCQVNSKNHVVFCKKLEK